MGGPTRHGRARPGGPSSSGSLRSTTTVKSFDNQSAQSEHDTFVSSCEWKAFQESIEHTLENQFQRQQCFIQRQFEQLVLPGACAKYDIPDEGWKGSMEAYMKRIAFLLENQQADLPFQSEGFCSVQGETPVIPIGSQERRLRLGAFDDNISESQASVGTDRPCNMQNGLAAGEEPEGAGGFAGAGLQRGPAFGGTSRLRRQHSMMSVGGTSVQSAPSVQSSHAGGQRTPRGDTRCSQKKLNWQIRVQDRAQDRDLMHVLGNSKTSGSSMRDWWDSKFFKWLDWWMSIEEPERRGCLPRFIQSKMFEAFCATVIIANACFTANTTNYEVMYMEEHPTSDVVEFFFLAFYVIELILKFIVHRLYFFCNEDMKWNILDLFLVLIAVYYQFMIWIFKASGIDLTYMRTLRVLKVARILRVIRVAKIFTELRLMLISILGSFQSLFWSFVMLAFVFYIFGLVFVQGTASYLKLHGEELDLSSKHKIIKTFGSVERAMLSLYKATTGGSDWENLFDDPIIENMGATNIVLFIFLIAFIQVALLNILTAVFVENALKLAQPDRDQQALEQRRKELLEAQELRRLFEAMDNDNSGTVDPHEFSANFQKGKLRAHMRVLGLHVKDADTFYEMLMPDGDSEEVKIDDFVDRCMRLRGTATSLDLQTVLHHVMRQNTRMREFFQACDLRFNELSCRVALFNPNAARPLQSMWQSEPRQDSRSFGGSEGCSSPMWPRPPGGTWGGVLSQTWVRPGGSGGAAAAPASQSPAQPQPTSRPRRASCPALDMGRAEKFEAKGTQPGATDKENPEVEGDSGTVSAWRQDMRQDDCRCCSGEDDVTFTI